VKENPRIETEKMPVTLTPASFPRAWESVSMLDRSFGLRPGTTFSREIEV
jgi:hypothetical protein